eukprot:1159114-Pelagomonas_calceolata.AAC.10
MCKVPYILSALKQSLPACHSQFPPSACHKRLASATNTWTSIIIKPAQEHARTKDGSCLGSARTSLPGMMKWYLQLLTGWSCQPVGNHIKARAILVEAWSLKHSVTGACTHEPNDLPKGLLLCVLSFPSTHCPRYKGTQM